MEIFRLFGSIFVDNEEANKSIAKTEEKAEGLTSKLAKGIGTAAKWGAGIAGAATAVVGGMLAAANKTAEYADKIDKLSERTGINIEELQRWKYAAGQSGADINVLETGIKKLSDTMDAALKGNKAASEAFDALGISLQNADGSARSTEAVFQDVMAALADMEQGAQRNALGNDVLGKSYTELLPLLNAGSAGMEELKNRADELGIVMSEEAVKANVQFGDTLADVKDGFGAIFRELTTAFLPILQKVLDWIVEHMPQIEKTFSVVFGTIGKVVGTVVDIIGGVLNAIDKVIGAAQRAWDWLKKVFGGGGKATYTPAPTPTPDMPALASGGDILRSGWALVGERGPELAWLPTGAQVRPLGTDSVTINQTINVTGPVDSQTLRQLDEVLDRRNTDLVTRLRLARPGVLP